MKTLLSLIATAGATALLAAAPAPASPGPAPAPVSTFGLTLHASGTVLDRGDSGQLGQFKAVVGAGKSTIVFTDPARHLTFKALTAMTMSALPNAVRATGLGLANGKLVHYTMVAVTYFGTGVPDRFGLIWGHHAMLGGQLQTGSIHLVRVAGRPGGAARTALAI